MGLLGRNKGGSKSASKTPSKSSSSLSGHEFGADSKKTASQSGLRKDQQQGSTEEAKASTLAKRCNNPNQIKGNLEKLAARILIFRVAHWHSPQGKVNAAQAMKSPLNSDELLSFVQCLRVNPSGTEITQRQALQALCQGRPPEKQATYTIGFAHLNKILNSDFHLGLTVDAVELIKSARMEETAIKATEALIARLSAAKAKQQE